MQARSAAGRAIVAEVETGVAPAKSYERTIKIRKATIETRIGVRFGLHPETKQVIITELYSGYPAHDCGNLFVGDVVTRINKTLVTDVDMASQLVKMTEGEVELKTENVYMSPHKAGTPGNPARTFTPASASAQRSAAPPPPPPPEVDLLGGFDAAPAPAPAPAAAAPPVDLLGDLVLGDDELFASVPPAVPAAPAAFAAPPAGFAAPPAGFAAPPAGFAPPQQPAGFAPPLMPTTQVAQAFGQSPTAPSIQQQVQMLYAQAPPPTGPPGTGRAAARPAAPPGNPNDPWNKGANILNFS